MIRPLILLFAALVSALPVPAMAERVRDLGQFQSVRSNQLTGYGIVVGLDGSGDDNFAYATRRVGSSWAAIAARRQSSSQKCGCRHHNR